MLRCARSCDAGCDVTALGADAGHQQWQLGGERAHAGQFGGHRRADHQPELAAAVPGAGGEAGDALVEPLAADIQRL